MAAIVRKRKQMQGGRVIRVGSYITPDGRVLSSAPPKYMWGSRLRQNLAKLGITEDRYIRVRNRIRSTLGLKPLDTCDCLPREMYLNFVGLRIYRMRQWLKRLWVRTEIGPTSSALTPMRKHWCQANKSTVFLPLGEAVVCPYCKLNV